MLSFHNWPAIHIVLVQSAESIRARAEEAITCIQYMQSFAACTDFGELPDLFQDSSRLSEAAVSHLFKGNQILVYGPAQFVILTSCAFMFLESATSAKCAVVW